MEKNFINNLGEFVSPFVEPLGWNNLLITEFNGVMRFIEVVNEKCWTLICGLNQIP